MYRKLRVAALVACGAWGSAALASSHREAPFITKSPKVDSTDLYVFRSYEHGREDFVTLIANYQPFQDAYGGPNYFTMDPEALYEIHIDNNGDAKEDLTFVFRFQEALAGGEGVKLDVGPEGSKQSVATVVAPKVFSRADLVQAFLTGVPNVNQNGSTAEMQRLNSADRLWRPEQSRCRRLLRERRPESLGPRVRPGRISQRPSSRG